MVREMVGVTNGLKANPGTVRGNFASSQQMNLVHASDGPEAAQAQSASFSGSKRSSRASEATYAKQNTSNAFFPDRRMFGRVRRALRCCPGRCCGAARDGFERPPASGLVMSNSAYRLAVAVIGEGGPGEIGQPIVRLPGGQRAMCLFGRGQRW